MPDSVRLAVGTLTRLPVPAPRTVTHAVARDAMVLAPVVGGVLALVVGVVVQALAPRLTTPVGGLLLGALAIAALAYLTRALHLDGLADTADALGSGRPADQALAIARRSDIGPFGVVTLVLVLLLQVVAYAGLVDEGAATAGLVIAVSGGRLAITLGCVRGVPAARPDGLGATVAESVPPWVLVVLAVAWAGVLSLVGAAAGLPVWAGPSAVVGSLAAGAIVIRTATTRLGGITGDVLGAATEIATTAALVILVACAT
jgi:adenosylcobinamide-GDP ribazoletransferase